MTFTQLLQETKDEAIEEGRLLGIEEGIEKGRVEGEQNTLKKNIASLLRLMDVRQVADALQLPLSTVERIAAEINATSTTN